MLPIALLLFPALSCASININIKAAPEKYDTLVTHVGKDSSVISDSEKLSFDLSDQTLKEAVSLSEGGKPVNVYLKRPTPWGDLYKTYGWAEVRRDTKVRRVNTEAVKLENVTLAKKLYSNNLTKEAFFNANVKKVVTSRVSNVFKGVQLSVDAKLNIELGQGVNPFKHLEFVSHLQNNTVLKVNKTMRANNEIQFSLRPLEAAEVFLNATKVTMHVMVDYETILSGYVAVNYNPKYKGHHFWAYGIQTVLKAAGKPLVQKARDLIVVEYFTDAKVVLIDGKTGSLIQSVDAVYVD